MELRLNPDDNPGLKLLWNQRIALGKEWSDLNFLVVNFERRTFWLGGTPKGLLQIGVLIHEYERRWIEWDAKAREFSLGPRLLIDGDEKSHPVTFLHYTAEFRSMISEMYANMRLIQQNYNMTCEHFFNQRNLALSWLGIVLGVLFGIIGITISL